VADGTGAGPDAAVLPSPKSSDQAVRLPSGSELAEPSNVTVSGSSPVVGVAASAATGGRFGVTETVAAAVAVAPRRSVTRSEAV